MVSTKYQGFWYKFLKHTKKLLIILISIFIAIFLYYPTYMSVGLIMWLYRESVIYFAKKRHNDWIPTTILGGAFASNDPRNVDGLSCLCLTAEFDKPCDPVKLEDKIKQLLSVNENAQLKSYFTRWMGIYFLKPCPQFAAESIISMDFASDPAEIKARVETFCFKPFEKYQPLWQFLILPNATADTFSMTFRAHHGLLDGISILRLIHELGDNAVEEDIIQESISKLITKYMPQLSWTSKLLLGLEIVFVTPFQLVYTGLKSANFNLFTNSGISGKIIHCQHRFDATRIKRIAQRLGYNGNIVFSGALIGALRNEMLSRGKPAKDMSLIYILPSTKHISKTLGNYAVGTLAVLPISEADRRKRLIRTDAMFAAIRKPAWLLHCEFGSKLLCLLGPILIKMQPKFWRLGVWSNTSSFGLESKWMYGSKTAKHVVTHCGLQSPKVPIFFVVQKFEDEVVLYVVSYESIFPNMKTLEAFFKRVENELEHLAVI